MITQTAKRSLVSERQAVLAAAWAGMLLASMLPGIVWQEVFGGSLPQALWLRLGGGLAFLGLSLAWKALRPLSGYFVLLAAILAADELLRPLVAASAVWQGWFGPDRASLFWSSLGPQLLRLLMSLAVWLVLVLLGLKRSDYFLVRGRLNAPAEPARWLGIRAGQPWSQAAVQFAIAMSLVFLAISVLAYRPGLGALAGALPWLPAVLLFAALNAFNENFIARAAPLSQLVSAVGQPQALLLSTVFFALGHFYGTPGWTSPSAAWRSSACRASQFTRMKARCTPCGCWDSIRQPSQAPIAAPAGRLTTTSLSTKEPVGALWAGQEERR